MNAFLREHVADTLEPLILGNRDRPAIAFALYLARRVLRVGLHQLFDLIADRYQFPGPLREVIHENVVALLWVLPQVEHLGNGGDILVGPLPSLITVNGEPAGRRAIVAAEIEYRLIVSDTGRTRAQFILSEIKPRGAC